MTHLSPIENLFAVEVPDDAHNFRIDIWFKGEANISYHSRGSLFGGEYLPPGSYEILFTTKECSEEQAGSVARWFELNGKMGWKNYQSEHVSFPFKTAAESIQSLLRANGLNPETNILLIKKIA